MNEIIITLANRKYRVGYEEGQEQELQQAVQLLNEEMEKLGDSRSGMQENQHLMLGGLLLAYRFINIDRDQDEMREMVREFKNELVRVKSQASNFVKSEHELQSKIKTLGDEKAQLNSKLEEATTEIEALKTSLEAGDSQAQSQDVALQDELNSLKEQLNDFEKLKSELQELRRENAELKEKSAPESRAVSEDQMAGVLSEMVASLEEIAK